MRKKGEQLNVSAKEFEEITLYAFCYNNVKKQIKHVSTGARLYNWKEKTIYPDKRLEVGNIYKFPEKDLNTVIKKAHSYVVFSTTELDDEYCARLICEYMEEDIETEKKKVMEKEKILDDFSKISIRK